MKLYRSLGRIWTGTQQDAKQAQGGKDFETIEVPTDKPGLLTWLNTFDVRPGDDPRDSDGMVLPHEDRVLWTDDTEIPDPEARPIASTAGPGNPPPVSPSACPACHREKRAAAMVASASATICARADAEDVSDPASIDDLIARLQRRREALGTVTVLAADPVEDVLG